MDLRGAWEVLGYDLDELICALKSYPTVEERVEAAERACRKAKKIAKGKMAKNHPDVNQDPDAVSRFRNIQKAMEVITGDTEQLRESMQAIESLEPRGDLVILIYK